MLHRLRLSEDFVASLSFVALDEHGQIVGFIACSKAKLVLDAGGEKTLLCLGPLAVAPDCQNRGIGSQLIRLALKKAREQGWGAATLTGDPRYYRRFGFRAAERWDIRNSDGMWATAHLAMPFKENFLQAGFVQESAAFAVSDNEAFEAFERTFAPKEKAHRPSQDEFARMVSLVYPVIDADI